MRGNMSRMHAVRAELRRIEREGVGFSESDELRCCKRSRYIKVDINGNTVLTAKGRALLAEGEA